MHQCNYAMMSTWWWVYSTRGSHSCSSGVLLGSQSRPGLLTAPPDWREHTPSLACHTAKQTLHCITPIIVYLLHCLFWHQRAKKLTHFMAKSTSHAQCLPCDAVNVLTNGIISVDGCIFSFSSFPKTILNEVLTRVPFLIVISIF